MTRWLLLVLLVSLAAPAAGAVDLTFGAEGETGWDSNVVNVEDGPSSWVGKIGPTVKVKEPQGDLTYELSYRARYDAYYDLHGLDGWEHYANLNGDYRLAETTHIRFGNLFQFLPVGSTQFENLNSISGQPVPGQVNSVVGQNRVMLNSASATLTHSFSPVWFTEAALSNDYYDPRAEGLIPSVTTTGRASLLYAVERTDQIGLGVGVTAQQFLATNQQASTHTEYYNVYGVWRHDFSPSLKLDVQAGPTLVDASQQELNSDVIRAPIIALTSDGRAALFSDCRPSPDGLVFFTDCNPTLDGRALAGLQTDIPLIADQQTGGTDLTYFANVVLTKEWETVSGRLSYTRNASNSGGLNTSSVQDTVSGTVSWRPTELWNVSLTALWSRRESATEQFGVTTGRLTVDPLFLPAQNVTVAGSSTFILESSNRAIDLQNYLVSLQVSRQIWRRLTVYGSFIYAYQKQKDSIGSANFDYDAQRFNLGLRYEFDPIQLF